MKITPTVTFASVKVLQTTNKHVTLEITDLLEASSKKHRVNMWPDDSVEFTANLTISGSLWDWIKILILHAKPNFEITTEQNHG